MTNESSKKSILVLGAGNFGTCLGNHLAKQGHHVELWTRSHHTIESINKLHRHPNYLTSVNLSTNLSATDLLDDAAQGRADAIILAVNTQALREVISRLSPNVVDESLLICAAKGIEINTLLFPLDIIDDLLGTSKASRSVILSGPSFAAEVASGQPTAVSVASNVEQSAVECQRLFHAPTFRVYTSSDPIGLEIAGALKNVIALAAGAAAGLGYQMNSSAALITRGLAEITRFGVAFGANPLTFNGLGGVGDLFLTCSSKKSRNYSVGYRLGAGESLEAVMGSQDSVVEGVTTARAAVALAKEKGVRAPICDAVWAVLSGQKSIKTAVAELLSGNPRPEIE